MSHSGNPNDPNDKSHLFDDDDAFADANKDAAGNEFDDIDPSELAAAKQAEAPASSAPSEEIDAPDEDADPRPSAEGVDDSDFDFAGQSDVAAAAPDSDASAVTNQRDDGRTEPEVETDFEAVAARTRGAQARNDRRKRAAIAGAGALVFFGGVATLGYLALSGGSTAPEESLVPAVSGAQPIAPMGAPVGSGDDFYGSLPQPETMAAVVTDAQRDALEGTEDAIDASAEAYEQPSEDASGEAAYDFDDGTLDVASAESAPDQIAGDSSEAEAEVSDQSAEPVAEAPAAVGGAATRAWSTFIAGVVEPMMQRVTVRLDTVDERVAAVEQKVESYGTMSAEIQKLREELAVVRREQKVAAAAPRRAAPVATSAPTAASGVAVRATAGSDPRVILDRYTIETPDGLLTRAKLWFDAHGAKGLKADHIKVQQTDAGGGRYAVTVEIPNAVVNERPPAAKGFIRTARTYILPEVRKFEYIAGKEIDIDVAITDEAVDILMGPAGHRDTETAMLSRATKPNAQWQPVAVTGMRRLADGRLVQVQREPNQTGSAGITGRPQAPLSYVSPQQRGVAVVPAMSAGESLAYRSGEPNPTVIDDWGTAAMTDTLAIIVNNRTGQRISVMSGTFIPTAGTVASINLKAREVVTDRGRILPLR